MGMIPIPDVDLGSILPAMIVCLTGVVVMFAGAFFRRGVIAFSATLSFVGVLIALAVNIPMRFMERQAFMGLVSVDSYGWFWNMVLLIAVGVTILTSVRYLAKQAQGLYEYFALLLFATGGMMFMVSANHFLVIFIGLETLSIAIYVLAAMMPTNERSREAGLKYLLLGAFSSAIFLYGAALLYGATGSLSLPAIGKYFHAVGSSPMAMAGMGLVLIGFSFKAAVAPFHMWTPDVYEGAPTPLTGYMSVAVKAAAFAVFVRVFFAAFPTFQVSWTHVLWVLAVITMVVGNVVALMQENIKRMLAYSSIAHAGYILVGMITGTEAGVSAILYYALAYTFTNLGAFAIVALVGKDGEANLMLDDYRGLGKAHPLLALVMSIFLFSLAGIPPTAGFVGKFAIFGAAVDSGHIWLVVIGVLTSAVSVFYYFRVIMKMYMETAVFNSAVALQIGPGMVLALFIAVAGVLYIGIFPMTYLDLALESVRPLF